MIHVFYFDKLDGFHLLRVAPRFEDVKPCTHALECTISKWEFITDHLDGLSPSEVWPKHKYCDGGGSTTALCWLHLNCSGCPVAAKTGQLLCKGTPYQRWVKEQTHENAKRMRNWLRRLKTSE